MRKILFALLSLTVCSCDHFGSSKVKNLIDLTPKLEVEKNNNLHFNNAAADPLVNQVKTSSYDIAKRAIIAEPVISKNMIYSVDKEGYAFAFSFEKKKIIWASNIAAGELDRHFSNGGILLKDGKLYITYGSRNLVVLDANTGHEVIRKEFPDILRSKPVMANEKMLIVQTIGNQLVCYDIQNSKFMWIHEGGIETISSQNHVHPVVYEGYIIASYSSGDILCLNLKDGSEKWRYSLVSSGSVGTPSFNPFVVVTEPIISMGNIYFAASNNKILKLNLHNGSVVWSRDASDIQSMTLHEENLFITNNARQVAALSALDGKINWVGNLISEKERSARKPQPLYFQKPFISKIANEFAVNVIASNGELYQFVTSGKGGFLPTQPIIKAIDKNVRYFWLSCCSNKLHLITNYKITF